MNQLFMSSRSLSCDEKGSYWREIFSKAPGSICLLLMLTMLIPAISFAQDVIYTAPSPYAPAGSPCSAHRWFAGDGWRKNDNTNSVANTWEAVVVASPRLQPKGIVRCASSAEAESGLQNFKGVYNPSDFAIPSTLTDIFDMSAGAGQFTGASINGPTAGEDIVWLNFDIRPFAGTYQFQVVTNERVGWALYHVPVSDARPINNPTPTPDCISYPTIACNGRDVSGNINCPNPTLVPANIKDLNTQLPRGYAGLSGNGWSTITVPSFARPTNYYLAMWMESTSVTTFPSSMNLVYKSRFGCGGSTCSLELLDSSVTCNNTGGKTVCATFGGSFGQWFFDDVNNNGSNFTVTYIRTDGSSAGTFPLLDGGAVTLDGGTGGIVKAKICGDFAANANYDITLIPNQSYTPQGGQNYIPCKDTAWLRGNQGVPACNLQAVATAPGLQVLGGSCDYAFQPSVANGTSINMSTTGAPSGSTITWGTPIPDPSLAGKFTFTSSAGGTATFNLTADGAGLIKFPVSSLDNSGCTCRDTLCIEIRSICPGGFDVTGPSNLCKFSPGVYTHNAFLDPAEFTYNWSIIPSSAGTITANNLTATVTPNGSSSSFYVRMILSNIIFGTECFRDSVLVNVIDPEAGDITGTQTICKGSCVTTALSGVSVTPPTGCTVSYLWETSSSCSGPTWTSAGTTPSISPCPAATAVYRRITSVTCGGVTCRDTSNCVTVTVIDLDGGTIGANQTICKGSCASDLTGPVPSGYSSCTITYLWQSASSVSGPWTTAGSGQNLSNVCPSSTTIYRRITSVTCNGGTCFDTSNNVTITVIDLDGGIIGSNQTICKGSCASNLTGPAPTGYSSCTITYLWQSAPSGSGPWTTAGTSQDLSNVCPTVTTFYRRITSAACNGGTCLDTSNTVTVSVIDPEGGDISSNQTICKGSCATNLTGAAVVPPSGCTAEYLWQRATLIAGPWATVGTSQNLNNVCPTENALYRRITSVTCNGVTCRDTSNCITITVIDPEAGFIAGEQTICKGSCAAPINGGGPVTATGCTVTYQWQSSSSCASTSWSNISAPAGTAEDLIGVCPSTTTIYRRITSVTCDGVTCRDTSNCITVNVIDPEAGDISGNQTICKGSCASTLTGGAPSGTTGCTVEYLWQSSSSCSGPWSSAGTSQNLSNVCPSVTSVYRRITSVTCNGVTCRDTSNCVTVTVIDPEAGNITGTQTICKGSCVTTPVAGSNIIAPSGCNVTYQWQSSSSCSGSWSNVTAPDPCPLVTTSYRRITSVTCNGVTCRDTSNCVTVTVIDLDAGVISQNQAICEGSCASDLTGPAPTGYSGCTITYLWQSAPSGSGPWSTAGNSQNLSNVCPTVTTVYRRITSVACNGGTCLDTSNTVTVTVIDPEGGDIGFSQTICLGSCATTLTGNPVTPPSGCSVSYIWQSTNAIGGPWVNVGTGQNLSGVCPTVPTMYHRITVVTCGGVTCRDTSNCVEINVINPESGLIAGEQTICKGSCTTPFNGGGPVSATGCTVTYQWQSSSSCSGPWTNIAGPGGTSEDLPSQCPASSIVYRRITSVTCDATTCRDTSNCVIVTVIDPEAGDIGQSQTICKGGTAAPFTGGTPSSTGCSVTYTWQSSSSTSGPWVNISGSGSGLPGQSPATNTCYRRITAVTCNGVTCRDTSNVVCITVIDPEAGNITGTQTICKGSSCVLPAGASVTPPTGCLVSYQWQSSSSCSGPWTNIGSPTCPNVTTSYRRITSVTCNGVTCFDTSNCVTITVIDPEAGDIGQSQTICKGSTAAPFTGGTPSAAGGCTVTYTWQSSSSASGPWANIPSAVGVGLPGQSPATSTCYRRITSVTCNGVTCSDTSNAVCITVIDPEAGNISASQTICRGACPSQLTGGAPVASGSCQVSYTWQSASSCTGPWTNAGTGQNFTPPCPFNANTSYRRITFVTCNGVTCSDTSNCVTITINDVDGGVIDGDTTICNGNTPGTLTGTAGTGSGSISYEWFKSESGCNGPWTAIALSNSQNYTPGALANTTCYIRVTSSLLNGVVCRDTSNCICVTVNLCSDNCSYTQGYYGSPGKSCDGVRRYNSATELITELLGVNSTPNPIVMGDPALNSFTIPGTAAAAVKVNSILPGGKTPRALPAIGNCGFFAPCFDNNILTLRGRINNVLLSQALVLTLNSRMNNNRLASFPIRKGWIVTQERSGCGQLSSPVPCSSNEGAIQSWQINESVWAFLTNGGTVNATVTNLINLANKVLGGTWVPGTTPLAPGNTFPVPSFSAVSGACGAFNEGFDECRSFLGYFNCPQNCDNYGLPCPAASTPMFEKVSVPVSGTREPKVEVFPNPFVDQATFVIESPVEAKASLKVYNAMGQLVSVVFQGVIPAGKSKNILFRSNVADGSLFYIYEQNGRKVTGKLIKQ